ncbi:C3HC zinc finger-like-domain-containing protein [Fomitopsis serialis]|uniref:C3HC zinc finger-like-domain-containing protein n=1 Tax=Fomitopsis serialis TaxID=139415 RepID=UPI002007F835|nr:C3HC zinc finger-like-domain-containing protein [Neoantrodia serialis]KAH9916168.1 C3HC zinc finger-like-domain-containing protein [Neoantrodia serialis]
MALRGHKAPILDSALYRHLDQSEEQVTNMSIILATSSSMPTLHTTTIASEKSIKRKLEDAIHTLDEAVAPTASQLEQQPPAKKQRTSKNLYATLAKYGIRKESKAAQHTNELETLSKTAPHLAAILTRSATRTRQALPWKLGHSQRPATAPSSTTEYRPSSMQSFLSRLSTFKLSTYSNKPTAIDAVAAAKCGWVNDGKDRLVCGICDVSWVVGGREGMSRDAANTLVEKQRAQLVDMHKDGCPWKTRQCDDSIYRISLQAPAAMAREIKSRAAALNCVMQDVEIKHPMTSTQIQSLLSTISAVRVRTFAIPDSDSDEPMSTENGDASEEPQPSEAAIITALFGWSVLPPAPPPERPRTQSLSRASSVAPSTPARTPTRAASVMSLRESTPTPGTPSRARPMLGQSSSRATIPAPVSAKPDTTLLHCALCQRRVGLWAFMSPPQTNGDAPRPQQRRQLDVLREHRSYCPYVVRSTGVPSMPAPSSEGASASFATTQPSSQNTVEGWRAVFTVVMRHGMARKQRVGHGRSVSGRSANDPSASQGQGDRPQEGEAEVGSVEAMVADVKSRGGRDLLKYVKGLLG